jgi:hypothetical protein
MSMNYNLYDGERRKFKENAIEKLDPSIKNTVKMLIRNYYRDELENRLNELHG